MRTQKERAHFKIFDIYLKQQPHVTKAVFGLKTWWRKMKGKEIVRGFNKSGTIGYSTFSISFFFSPTKFLIQT